MFRYELTPATKMTFKKLTTKKTVNKIKPLKMKPSLPSTANQKYHYNYYFKPKSFKHILYVKLRLLRQPTF